jgi:hypothetical protein
MRRETVLLVDLCGREGLTRPELLVRVRERAGYLQPADVERSVRQALADGHLIEREGRLCAPSSEQEPADPERKPPRRLIVFDLESIVRPIVKEPYREQHVFQIGAVRFGPDQEWVEAQPTFEAFTALASV